MSADPVREEAAAALIAALGEMDDLPRARTANVGTYTYHYTDLAAAMGAVRPILARHGLAATQPVMSDGQIVSVWTRIFHVSGFIWDSPALVMVQPPTAQALGSVVTYLRRYSLLAALGLATEDDDGQTAAVTPPRHGGMVGAESESESTERVRRFVALCRRLDLSTPAQRLAAISRVVGRDVKAWGDLSPVEQVKVIDALDVLDQADTDDDGRAALWDQADAEA